MEQSRVIRIAVLVVLLAALLPAPAPGAEERADCHLCGMWIDLYTRTHHVAELEDGTRVDFCSIACTARYLGKNAGHVRRVMAADFESTELIPADEAVYLAGSDAPPVMTYTSRIAFSTRERAEAFRATHGGRIITFQDALDELDAEY